MPHENESKNQYLEQMSASFAEAMKKKADMEENFKPEMIPEYEKLKKKLIYMSSDLLKLGAATADDETVLVEQGDEVYEIPVEEFRKTLDEEQFNMLFPKKDDPEDDEEYYDDDEIVGNNGNGFAYPWHGSSLNAEQNMQNPIASLVSALIAPLAVQSAQSPSAAAKSGAGKDLLKDVDSIQQKIVALDQARSNAKKKARKYEEECTRLSSQIAELEARTTAEKAETEAQIASLIDEKAQFEQLANNAMADLEAKESEISTLNSDIARMKEEHQETLASLQRENEHLSGQLQASDEQKAATETSLHEQEDKLNEIRMDLAEKESSLDAAQQRSDALQNEISTLNNEIAQLKEVNRQKDEEIAKVRSNAENDVKDTDKRISELREKLSETEDRLEKAFKKSDEHERNVSNLKKEKESIRTECDAAKKNVSALERKISENQKVVADKDRKIEDLQAQINDMLQEREQLERLAYEDLKNGVMNVNAFNRDFMSIAKDDTMLAMIGIRGLKNVNIAYGRESGDRLISLVAGELTSCFANNNIYRILGDQFVVLQKGTNETSFTGKLESIQHKLAGDDIHIHFGVAVGNRCDSLQKMIGTAETNMNKMKIDIQQMLRNMAEDDHGTSKTQNKQPVGNPVQKVVEEPAQDTATANSEEPAEVNMEEMLLAYMNS